MKGIILAGGTGSRLSPLTNVTNKHLLPVGRYPMIYWPLNSLFQCGIRDIMIVSGVEHMGSIVEILGSGQSFNARFTYRVQDQAGGIAQALGLCRQLCAGFWRRRPYLPLRKPSARTLRRGRGGMRQGKTNR